MGANCAIPARAKFNGKTARSTRARYNERNILYGCVWRALPHDFPVWQTVYYYNRLFQKSLLWEQLNNIIREQVRVKEGREPQASALIIDSQSAEGGEEIGFDGGKLVRGRKRTLIVDTLGLVAVAKVTAANKADVNAGKEALVDAQMLGSLETAVWQETMNVWLKQANCSFIS